MSPWLSDLFLSSQSDERLVSLAREGHDRAFAVIVERYKRQLHAHARRIGPEARAEDVVQQAFLSSFAALRAGAEVSHLRGWLHQIVRNASIQAGARSPNEDELDSDLCGSAGLEDEVERRMLALQALSEVARLPDRQRDAFVETAVQGRSRTEVAVSMGLSEGAVRQLVHRARNTVRTAVTAITPYPITEYLAGSRPAAGLAELATGAASASAGGLVLKAGAFAVATGFLATGIVPSSDHPQVSGQGGRTHARMTQSAWRSPATAQSASAGTAGSLSSSVVRVRLGSGPAGGQSSNGGGGRGRGGRSGTSGGSGGTSGSGRSGSGRRSSGGPGSGSASGSGPGSGRSPGGSGSSGGNQADSGRGPGSSSGSSGSGSSGSGSSGSGSSGGGSSGRGGPGPSSPAGGSTSGGGPGGSSGGNTSGSGTSGSGGSSGGSGSSSGSSSGSGTSGSSSGSGSSGSNSASSSSGTNSGSGTSGSSSGSGSSGRGSSGGSGRSGGSATLRLRSGRLAQPRGSGRDLAPPALSA